MKMKLHAGAELDMLTKDELADTLRAFGKSWREEASRGVRYRRRAWDGIVAADGSLTIRADGPAEGMMWSITRVTFAGGTAGATGVNLYANEVAATQVLARGITTNLFPSETGIVLVSGDQLVIGGFGLTVAEQVIITASIKEVPTMLGWSA